MKRWWRFVALVSAITLAGVPGITFAASEVDILLDKLVEKGVLSGVEAGQIRREMAETKEERNKQLAKEIVPDSARNWKWKGDIRLRNEYRNRVGTGRDVNRQRLRLRYGFDAKVNDQVRVAARIATGATTNPISTNDTFDDFFNKKPFNLDLAYVEYSPEIPEVSKLAVAGGIMENPQWTVGPMVWDPDLNFDGVAAKVAQEMGTVTLFSNNGVFALDSDETEPATLWVTQGGVSMKPFDSSEDEMLKNLKLTAAIAYDDYMNVSTSAKAGTDPITNFSTNTSSSKDFNLLNPSCEIASQIAGYPLSVYGDWVRNVSAGSRVNNGYLFGLKFGKAKNPWSLTDGWEAGYFREWLESDAVFDEFTDSDFGGGGTNVKGHVYFITLAVLKNSTVGMKYLAANQIKGAKANENTVQFDWVTKF